MTHTNTAQLSGEAQIAKFAINQRPSFTRWNDPIARLPFLGHWLLSLLVLIAVPFIAVWAGGALGLGQSLLPLLVLACVPAVQLYWVSARRRLLDMGANTSWILLIVPVWVVLGLNAYDGAMATILPTLANSPTISREVGSSLLLLAAMLHLVLMLRRGASKSKAKRA